MTFHYALGVPARRSRALGEGDPRYGCCQQTEKQGHGPRCTEETRREHIERALRENGISFAALVSPDAEAPRGMHLDPRRCECRVWEGSAAWVDGHHPECEWETLGAEVCSECDGTREYSPTPIRADGWPCKACADIPPPSDLAALADFLQGVGRALPQGWPNTASVIAVAHQLRAHRCTTLGDCADQEEQREIGIAACEQEARKYGETSGKYVVFMRCADMLRCSPSFSEEEQAAVRLLVRRVCGE